MGLQEELPEKNVFVDTVEATPVWNNKHDQLAEAMWLHEGTKVETKVLVIQQLLHMDFNVESDEDDVFEFYVCVLIEFEICKCCDLVFVYRIL
ncbi:hypothetical protein SASPL_143694 [Salvia splendens]|uniref:Uncharacterized protein n=1 Tax=Salvia splendens TaxID=180675 RepID=A0A8X8WMJ1_SALSN|nr:hypothetical protein SASPL_143694 [Salvia splendens]